MSSLPTTDIKQLIPQKRPFEMVDTLLEYSQTSVSSSFILKEDNLFVVNGYFTEPGLIENMAQTVALHTGYNYFLQGKKTPTGYIGSIKSVEILDLPKSGEKIITTATILHEIMGVTMVNVIVKRGNAIIATGEMKTIIAKG